MPDNEYGGIPINGDGFEIAGKWEKPSFGPPMPAEGEGAPDMAGMPPMDEMPSMEGMPPMPEPKFYFTPDYDEKGNLIVIGKEKLAPAKGCIIGKDATLLGGLTNTPGTHRQQRRVGQAGERLCMDSCGQELSDPSGGFCRQRHPRYRDRRRREGHR